MMESWQIINSLFYLICAVYLFKDISCLYCFFGVISLLHIATDYLNSPKRAARIVLHADIMTPSETMFRELNWLLVQYHTYIFMYKTLNNSAPDLSERFMKISETHDRNLRSADSGLLKVPYSRTRYYDNPFTVTAAKMGNSLPLRPR